MTAKQIREHLSTGAKACKIVDANYNYVGYELYKCNTHIGTIRKCQFAKLLADTSLQMNMPVGSIRVIEIYA